MNFDRWFPLIAFRLSWLLTYSHQVQFGYRAPLKSDRQRLRKHGRLAEVSLTHARKFQWLAILLFTASMITAARLLRDMVGTLGWLAIGLTGLLGVLAHLYSMWWHICLRFGKRSE